MSRLLPLVVGLLGLFGGVARGEGVLDFSSGFEELLKLGLPDRAGGEYVDVSEAGGQYYYSEGADELKVKLNERGWVVRAKKEEGEEGLGEPVKLILSGLESYSLPSAEEIKARNDLIKKARGGDESVYAEYADLMSEVVYDSSRFKEADELADAKKLTKRIGKLEAVDGDSWDWGYKWADAFGQVLVFAALLYEDGQVEAASGLASALFGAVEDPEVVVDAGVSVIAKTRLNSVTKRFQAEGGWGGYERGIQELVDAFPRGWKLRPGAEVLLERIQEHRGSEAKLELPEEASFLDGEELRGLLYRIVTEKGAAEHPWMSGWSGWVLGEDDQVGSTEQQREASATAMTELIEQGIHAIPPLCALVYHGGLTNTFSRDSEQSYSDGDESGEELYSEMKRPLEVADAAREWLEGAVPEGLAGDTWDMSNEEMADVAMEWWVEYSKQDERAIAMVYLTEGSDTQVEAGLGLMGETGTDEDFAKVEERILSEEYPGEYLNLLEAYGKARKRAAAPMVKKYEKQFRAGFDAAEEEDYEYEIAQLDQVLMLVGEMDAEEVLAGLVSGDRKIEESQYLIGALIEGLPQEEFGKLIKVAGEIKPSSTRLRFLQLVGEYGWGGDALEEVPGEVGEWNALLGDTRSVGGLRRNSPAHQAAYLYYAATLSEVELELLDENYHALGDRVPDYLLSEVKATLEFGAPLPPVVGGREYDRIDAEIWLEEIEELGDEGLQTYLSEIGVDGELIIQEYIEEGGKVPGNLEELAKKVVELDLEEGFLLADAIDWEGLVGSVFDEAMLEQLQGALIAALDKGSEGGMLLISQGPLGSGVVVRGVNLPTEEDEPNQFSWAEWIQGVYEGEEVMPPGVVMVSGNEAGYYRIAGAGGVEEAKELKDGNEGFEKEKASMLKNLVTPGTSAEIYFQVIPLSIEEEGEADAE